MAKTDWLPPRAPEFLAWLKHEKDTLPALKVILGLADADVTARTVGSRQRRPTSSSSSGRQRRSRKAAPVE